MVFLVRQLGCSGALFTIRVGVLVRGLWSDKKATATAGPYEDLDFRPPTSRHSMPRYVLFRRLAPASDLRQLCDGKWYLRTSPWASVGSNSARCGSLRRLLAPVVARG